MFDCVAQDLLEYISGWVAWSGDFTLVQSPVVYSFKCIFSPVLVRSQWSQSGNPNIKIKKTQYQR
jgi:hypothetical protein